MEASETRTTKRPPTTGFSFFGKKSSEKDLDIAVDEHPQNPVHVSTSAAADPEKESFSENAQAGVQKVEAAAMVWTQSNLIAAYAL